MTIPVGLSTSSVFPEPAERAFELAAELGYDGVEVGVTAERISQDAAALGELAERHGVPVLSIHSPCLLVTARVWGTDPIVKMERSVEMARAVGAPTVVVHPPFVWQRAAIPGFRGEVQRLVDQTRVRVAVENMYPVKRWGTWFSPYRPHWDPVVTGYPWYTLDLSHTAAAGVDAVDMAARMGDRLAHVHLGDGTGEHGDEHLVPGRGEVACDRVLAGLAEGGFTGAVVAEVSTRSLTAGRRVEDLAETLAFARAHLG